MAVDKTFVLNEPQNLGAVRWRAAIDYSGGNQTVSAATGGAFTQCRGLHVTVAGDFVVTYAADTSVTFTVPLGVGYWGDCIVQINQTGSTGSGFYLF